MSAEDRIKYWKDSPEGSREKRSADEYLMDFNSYLAKYFSDSNYYRWSRWCEWFPFIEAAFDEEKHKTYKGKTGYYRVDYDFKRYKKTLDELIFKENLPIEIKKVIAFLVNEKFFEYYKIRIDDWLKIKNFDNPQRDISDSDLSMSDLLKVENGANYIKEKLINLKWWDITRGDPQGF